MLSLIRVTRRYDDLKFKGVQTMLALQEIPIFMETKGSPDDLLTPHEAADYLAQRWKRKSFSVEGLRSLRRREGLKPVKQMAQNTLYRRSDLDNIPEPKRGPKPSKLDD